MEKKIKLPVVIFDFDGTLTFGKTNKTTWETIWEHLGYPVLDCKELHARFNREEITHEQWCEITQEKFIAKSLHQDYFDEIVKKIKLFPDIKFVFEYLRSHYIKIYIVSGSILQVIQRVLGSYCQYVDDISANSFIFDNNGLLLRIVGTKYDFLGKAHYIQNIMNELKVPGEDILFVGNSINDQQAYFSGAKTLLINPIHTDTYNSKIWNHVIEESNSLKDILKYVKI